MKKWLIVLLILDLAACKVSGTALPIPTEATAEVTEAVQDDWEHFTAGDIEIGVRIPDGWQSVPNDYGILLAEHTELVRTQTPEGILIYLFIPVMDGDLGCDEAVSSNKAYEVLNVITSMPQYVGDSTVNEPLPFYWDGHDSAYYLLTDKDGNHTMVIAMVVPDTENLVVVNISSSPHDADRIRNVVPIVLSSLTVNGTAIDVSSLNMLPDPLPFPEHYAYRSESHEYGEQGCHCGCDEANATAEP